MFFSGQKYGAAAVKVLIKLKDDGALSNAEYLQMQRAAVMNNLNYAYGKALVKSRAASSPAAAAAAVFARLAVAAESAPGEIKPWLWEMAAALALQNAGASAFEQQELLQVLKTQERAAGWGREPPSAAR